MRLEFSASWARRPEHSLYAQTGRKKIAENAGARGVAWKVSEEVWRLPMGDAGKNELLDIFQQRVKWFAVRRRLRGKCGANFSRLYLREYRERFDAGLVVGDPVDDGVTVATEFVGRHVEGFFGGQVVSRSRTAARYCNRPKYIFVL